MPKTIIIPEQTRTIPEQTIIAYTFDELSEPVRAEMIAKRIESDRSEMSFVDHAIEAGITNAEESLAELGLTGRRRLDIEAMDRFAGDEALRSVLEVASFDLPTLAKAAGRSDLAVSYPDNEVEIERISGNQVDCITLLEEVEDEDADPTDADLEALVKPVVEALWAAAKVAEVAYERLTGEDNAISTLSRDADDRVRYYDADGDEVTDLV